MSKFLDKFLGRATESETRENIDRARRRHPLVVEIGLPGRNLLNRLIDRFEGRR